MSYAPAAENAALLLRTARGIADFSARSRRTEVGYYWIAASLMNAVLGFILQMLLSGAALAVAIDLVGLILLVPYFALFVRRLHDMNQSGWWAMILPLGALAALPRAIAQINRDDAAPFAQHGFTLVDGLMLLVLVAVLAMTVTPGTIGPNRFGPDPREGGPDPGAA
jgi:uncharacterized membrane protein YhaH (DUF805 family)